MFEELIESIKIEISELKRAPKRKFIKVEYYKLLDKFSENYYVYELYVSEYISKMSEDVTLELISTKQKLDAVITSVDENQLIKVSTKAALTEDIYKINMDFDPSFLLQNLSDCTTAVKDADHPIVNQLLTKIETLEKTQIDDLYVIDDDELNLSQVEAISHAENNQISLIWGPPGTGKTHTLSKIIYRSYLRDESVLVLSTSNVALDHILIKLDNELFDDEKDDIVRLGNTNNKLVHRYTNESKLYIDKPKKVTFSTLANLSAKYSKLDNVDLVVVDEASMVSLPYIFVAASKSNRNLVLLGDFRQLPPIALNENNRLFQMSIFDYLDVSTKITQNSTLPMYIALLDTQYRMTAQISTIISELFYSGFLKCGTTDQQINPLNFINVDNTSYCDTYFSVADGSYFNPVSLFIIDNLLQNDIYTTQEILIVSPFRPQQNMLNAIFQDRPSAKGRSLTVHKSQGSEADVVIFDLTTHAKSNKKDYHQFFTTSITENLINVAMSRAKAKLYIIASMKMIEELQKESVLWKKLHVYFSKQFEIIDAHQMLGEIKFLKSSNEIRPTKDFTIVDIDCNRYFYDAIRQSKCLVRNYIARPGCIPSSERREVTFRDIENTHKLPNMAIVDENIILKEHDKFIALPFDKAAKILKRVALEKFIDTDEMDRASTFDLNCSKCGGNYMLYNKGSSTVLKCSKCHDTKYIGRSEALLVKDLYKLACPDCNADVTPRQKKGHSDYSFFGCLNYPHCNGSIHMYSVARGY